MRGIFIRFIPKKLQNISAMLCKVYLTMTILVFSAEVFAAEQNPTDVYNTLKSYVAKKTRDNYLSQNKDLLYEEFPSEDQEASEELPGFENVPYKKGQYGEDTEKPSDINSKSLKKSKTQGKSLVTISSKKAKDADSDLQEEVGFITETFGAKQAEAAEGDEPVTPTTETSSNTTPDSGTQASEPTPTETNSTPTADAATTPTAEAGAAGEVTIDPDNVTSDSWKTSILFSPEEINGLDKSLKEFFSGIPSTSDGTDNFDLFAKDVSEKQQMVSPSIYLNSIIYASDEDWKLWVNGKKYLNNTTKTAYKDQFSTVSIVGQDKDTVSFVLESISLNKLSPAWPTKLEKTFSGDFVSKDGKITISKMTNNILFTLKVNQTFVLYDMLIAEGYVAPTTIDTTKDAAATAGSAPKGARSGTGAQRPTAPNGQTPPNNAQPPAQGPNGAQPPSGGPNGGQPPTQNNNLAPAGAPPQK